MHALTTTAARQAVATQQPIFERDLPITMPGIHSTPHQKKRAKSDKKEARLKEETLRELSQESHRNHNLKKKLIQFDHPDRQLTFGPKVEVPPPWAMYHSCTADKELKYSYSGFTAKNPRSNTKATPAIKPATTPNIRTSVLLGFTGLSGNSTAPSCR